MVADLDGGRWAGITFFRGNITALKNLRTGLRIHRRWSLQPPPRLRRPAMVVGEWPGQCLHADR